MTRFEHFDNYISVDSFKYKLEQVLDLVLKWNILYKILNVDKLQEQLTKVLNHSSMQNKEE